MKMVKSLLLGSAAGLVAVAGAQAADLPVKAKAVEYVKVCSLYGVGYYYIPGTDTCIKIGGYVRYEAYHNAADGAYVDRNSSGRFTRWSNTFAQMARFRLTTDVRTQTEYGTLRSYVSFGFNWLNRADDFAPAAQTTPITAAGLTVGAPAYAQNGTQAGIGNFSFALERAFIQFAGFTFGRSDTFFGFYNGAAYGLVPMALDGSSGPAGHNVAAYTWQFGNGLSATLAIEDAWGGRAKPIVDINAGTAATFAGVFTPGADNAGQKVPDIVANLRVDQAWGSAQIMGGLHQVSAKYYHAATAANPQCGLGGAVANNNLSTTACFHPSDEWGWGVGAGLTLKMPWDAKDTLSGVIAYSEGASGFVAHGASAASLIGKSGGFAVAPLSDAVFAIPGQVAGYGGGLELTKTWGGTVAFEHYWTPSLRTSWVFGYLDISYSSTAKALIASVAGAQCGVTNTCNPDSQIWRLASRTMWNPVANLDIGVEVAYSEINSAFKGTAAVGAGQFGFAAGTYNVQDQGFWSATFRAQRSFWP